MVSPLPRGEDQNRSRYSLDWRDARSGRPREYWVCILSYLIGREKGHGYGPTVNNGLCHCADGYTRGCSYACTPALAPFVMYGCDLGDDE